MGCESEKSFGPDTTPPAAIADLRVEFTGCDSVRLVWTAPGDDGVEGTPSSYDLRRSREAITRANWASATRCEGEPAPGAAGRTELMTIRGLAAGTYHFACRAGDEAGNASELSNDASATPGSTAIAWVNDGAGPDEDWVTSAATMSASWAAAACATGYEYALGTAQCGANVIPWTSGDTQTSVTRTELRLVDGRTYYFSVRSLVGTVPGTATSSDGFTVDATPPTSRVLPLPPRTSGSAFTVAWRSGDGGSGVKHCDVQVSTDGGDSWDDWLTATTRPFATFTGTNGRTYGFRCRGQDNAGNVEAYPATPDAQITVALAGPIAWVNDGPAWDEDWVNSTTALSVNWASAGSVEDYEYSIGTSPGAANVVGWSSTGGQTAVVRGGLALVDGWTYYFSVRSVVGGTRGTVASSDGITVDVTSPVSQVNALPAEQPALTFTVTWSGSDGGSGILSYDIQVSSNGGASWSTWLAATTLTSAEYTGVSGQTCHFRSRAYDVAGNIETYPSVPDAFTTVNVTTNLQVSWVNDGLGADVDWTNSTNSLTVNWPAVTGADGYQSAVGTTPGGTQVRAWASAGTGTSVTVGGMNFVSGQTFYVSIRVVEGVAYGPGVSSDGVTVDAGLPSSAVGALPATSHINPFTVGWSGSDPVSGIGSYDIQVKDGDGGWQDWREETTDTQAPYFGTTDHTYYFRSRARDVAGNVESYPTNPDAWTVLTCAYEYQRQWGHQGSGDGEFGYTFEVAVSAAGDVYVVDQGNNRIQVFDNAGNFLRKWGSYGFGDGQFYGPAAVATDDSGFVYVTDFNNSRVQKFEPDGTFVTKWGSWGTGDSQFRYPRGLAVDNSFHVYVADDGNNRIQKFTSDGIFVTAWGTAGTGNGQLSGVMDVAIGPSGTIYAVDCYNDRIQEFTAGGVYLNKWGSYGTGNGQFSSPLRIDVDASGHVFVAENNGNRVQKFSSAGGFLTQWGSYGAGNGQFDSLMGLALGSGGEVYTVDLYNYRVQVFTPACP